MKLDDFTQHERISSPRVDFPAVKITRKGYMIFNSHLIKEVGKCEGGFCTTLFYSKSKQVIGIKFIQFNKKNIPKKNIRATLCAISFIKKYELSGQINHNEFYPLDKKTDSNGDILWHFSLNEEK